VEVLDAIKSVQQLAATLTERIDTLQDGLDEQRAAFFAQVSAERAETITQAQSALATVVDDSLEEATSRINAERVAAIDQLFDRFAQERSLLLDDLESRQGELLALMTELRETISTSGNLAHELTGTVDAIDRVVARFAPDPDSKNEPLQITDIRDAAIEATRAAEQVARVLELSNDLVESGAWDRRVMSLTAPADAIIDRVFWRSAILIGLFIGGLALLRLVPRSTGEKRHA
jgi:hypothetical protein